MVGLWRWFKSRGRANDKPVAEDQAAGATVAARKSSPRSKAAAVEQVAETWAEDGDRADQDYYHVPGASNPDLKNPPTLEGVALPKSAKKPRAKSGRA